MCVHAAWLGGRAVVEPDLERFVRATTCTFGDELCAPDGALCPFAHDFVMTR
jgi:hypothetical protein